MIIVKLQGGLGNQLFQYAHSKSVALKLGEKLLLDTTWYKGRINRMYMLDHFNISAREANILEMLFVKIFSKKNYLVDLTGQWHSESYFENYAYNLRHELVLKRTMSENSKHLLGQILGTNSISIHIRGGDYVRGNKSGFHKICSKEYYRKAVELINQSVSTPHFFIFTDDLPWAQGQFEFPAPYTIIGNPKNPDDEELILMSACKHNIIANSTFSWWAAWLNSNKNKKVIAPEKWFNDDKLNTKELTPPSWIRI